MINVSQSFHRTSANAVDDTLTLTKAQMLAVNDNLMPNKYFTVCQDDGAIYLYDKSATPSAETGKFTKFEGGDIENQTIDYEDFEELPQSEKDNGTAYFVPDVNIESDIMVFGNRFDKANIYTENERMIGSYLGKPLYQKVFDLGEIKSISNITWTKVGISASGMETILRAFGTNNYSGSGIFTLSSDLLTCAKDGEITFLVGRDGEIFECRYIILQYTKISDGIVSIGTGNDYSTDEQIIGTWIDGKKLYQKTIHDFTMPSQSNVPILNFLGVQIDKMIEIFGRCIDSNGFTFTFNPSFGDKVKCLYGTSNDAFIVQYVDASWAYNQKADITFVYTKVND